MWTYNKVLQYPVNIKCTDPRLAKVIISQYGGPDGELAASLRYLSQRFAMPVQGAVETATVPNTYHTESPDWQRKDVYGGEIDMRVDKAT